MTPEFANCVLEGLLLLHEELSQDSESPWYVGTPDQTQVLHDELWILAGELYPHGLRYCRLLNCTGELFNSRHLQLVV